MLLDANSLICFDDNNLSYGLTRQPNSLNFNKGYSSFICDNHDFAKCPSDVTTSNKDNYGNSFVCKLGFIKIFYECMTDETYNRLDTSIYFSSTYSFPDVIFKFDKYNYKEYFIEFWMYIDKNSYANSIKNPDINNNINYFYFIAYPHHIYARMASYPTSNKLTFYYLNSSNSKQTSMTYMSDRNIYEWIIVYISVSKNNITDEAYTTIYVNYDFKNPEINEVTSNIYDLNLKSILFCSDLTSNTTNTCGINLGNNNKWGFAWYKNIRVWQNTYGVSPSYFQEHSNLFDYTQKTILHYIEFYIKNLRINTLGEYYIQDYKDTSLIYTFSRSSGNYDYDRQFNYSFDFDYIEKLGFNSLFIYDDTNVPNACTSYCRRCFGFKDNECYECYEDYYLLSGYCLKGNKYYFRTPNADHDIIPLKTSDISLIDINKLTITFYTRIVSKSPTLSSFQNTECTMMYFSGNTLSSNSYLNKLNLLSDPYKKELKLILNNKVAYKANLLSLNSEILINKWIFISISINRSLDQSQYPNMLSLEILNNIIPVEETFNKKTEEVIVDKISFNYEVIAYYYDLRIYNSFLTGVFGLIKNTKTLIINDFKDYIINKQFYLNELYLIKRYELATDSINTGCLVVFTEIEDTFPIINQESITCAIESTIELDLLNNNEYCKVNYNNQYLDFDSPYSANNYTCKDCNNNCILKEAEELYENLTNIDLNINNDVQFDNYTSKNINNITKSSCYNSNKHNCSCFLHKYSFWIINENCEQVKNLNISYLKPITFPVRSSYNDEYTIEFWLMVYSYIENNHKFKSIDLIWDGHSRITIDDDKDSNSNNIKLTCYPYSEIQNPTQYEKENTSNNNFKYNMWLFIRCAVNRKPSREKYYIYVDDKLSSYINDQLIVKTFTFKDIKSNYETFLNYNNVLQGLNQYNIIYPENTYFKIIDNNSNPIMNNNPNYGFTYIRELKLYTAYLVKDYNTKYKFTSHPFTNNNNNPYESDGDLKYLLHYINFDNNVFDLNSNQQMKKTFIKDLIKTTSDDYKKYNLHSNIIKDFSLQLYNPVENKGLLIIPVDLVDSDLFYGYNYVDIEASLYPIICKDDEYFDLNLSNTCVKSDNVLNYCKITSSVDNNKCLLCNDKKKYLDFYNKCVDICEDGFYGEDYIKMCRECHKSCNTCIHYKDKDCTSCLSPLYLLILDDISRSGECISDCSEHKKLNNDYIRECVNVNFTANVTVTNININSTQNGYNLNDIIVDVFNVQRSYYNYISIDDVLQKKEEKIVESLNVSEYVYEWRFNSSLTKELNKYRFDSYDHERIKLINMFIDNETYSSINESYKIDIIKKNNPYLFLNTTIPEYYYDIDPVKDIKNLNIVKLINTIKEDNSLENKLKIYDIKLNDIHNLDLLYFKEGFEYVFQFLLTGYMDKNKSFNKTIVFDIILKIGVSPYGGDLKIIPDVGIDGITNFVISCNGFTEDYNYNYNKNISYNNIAFVNKEDILNNNYTERILSNLNYDISYKLLNSDIDIENLYTKSRASFDSSKEIEGISANISNINNNTNLIDRENNIYSFENLNYNQKKEYCNNNINITNYKDDLMYNIPLNSTTSTVNNITNYLTLSKINKNYYETFSNKNIKKKIISHFNLQSNVKSHSFYEIICKVEDYRKTTKYLSKIIKVKRPNSTNIHETINSLFKDDDSLKSTYFYFNKSSNYYNIEYKNKELVFDIDLFFSNTILALSLVENMYNSNKDVVKNEYNINDLSNVINNTTKQLLIKPINTFSSSNNLVFDVIEPNCGNNYCNGNGDCKVINDYAICICYNNYVGINCQFSINEYNSNNDLIFKKSSYVLLKKLYYDLLNYGINSIYFSESTVNSFKSNQSSINSILYSIYNLASGAVFLFNYNIENNKNNILSNKLAISKFNYNNFTNNYYRNNLDFIEDNPLNFFYKIKSFIDVNILNFSYSVKNEYKHYIALYDILFNFGLLQILPKKYNNYFYINRNNKKRYLNNVSNISNLNKTYNIYKIENTNKYKIDYNSSYFEEYSNRYYNLTNEDYDLFKPYLNSIRLGLIDLSKSIILIFNNTYENIFNNVNYFDYSSKYILNTIDLKNEYINYNNSVEFYSSEENEINELSRYYLSGIKFDNLFIQYSRVKDIMKDYKLIENITSIDNSFYFYSNLEYYYPFVNIGNCLNNLYTTNINKTHNSNIDNIYDNYGLIFIYYKTSPFIYDANIYKSAVSSLISVNIYDYFTDEVIDIKNCTLMNDFNIGNFNDLNNKRQLINKHLQETNNNNSITNLTDIKNINSYENTNILSNKNFTSINKSKALKKNINNISLYFPVSNILIPKLIVELFTTTNNNNNKIIFPKEDNLELISKYNNKFDPSNQLSITDYYFTEPRYIVKNSGEVLNKTISDRIQEAYVPINFTCYYIDEETLELREGGMIYSNYTSNNYFECQSEHLTDFSISYYLNPSEVNVLSRFYYLNRFMLYKYIGNYNYNYSLFYFISLFGFFVISRFFVFILNYYELKTKFTYKDDNDINDNVNTINKSNNYSYLLRVKRVIVRKILPYIRNMHNYNELIDEFNEHNTIFTAKRAEDFLDINEKEKGISIKNQENNNNYLKQKNLNTFVNSDKNHNYLNFDNYVTIDKSPNNEFNYIFKSENINNINNLNAIEPNKPFKIDNKLHNNISNDKNINNTVFGTTNPFDTGHPKDNVNNSSTSYKDNKKNIININNSTNEIEGLKLPSSNTNTYKGVKSRQNKKIIKENPIHNNYFIYRSEDAKLKNKRKNAAFSTNKNNNEDYNCDNITIKNKENFRSNIIKKYKQKDDMNTLCNNHSKRDNYNFQLDIQEYRSNINSKYSPVMSKRDMLNMQNYNAKNIFSTENKDLMYKGRGKCLPDLDINLNSLNVSNDSNSDDNSNKNNNFETKKKEYLKFTEITSYEYFKLVAKNRHFLFRMFVSNSIIYGNYKLLFLLMTYMSLLSLINCIVLIYKDSILNVSFNNIVNYY